MFRTGLISLLIVGNSFLFAQKNKTYYSLEESLKSPSLVYKLDLSKKTTKKSSRIYWESC